MLLQKTQTQAQTLLAVGAFEVTNFEEIKQSIINKKNELLKQLEALKVENGNVEANLCIKDFKEFKTKFNTLSKSLNDERVKQKKVYDEGFRKGKEQLEELKAIADDAVSQVQLVIDEYTAQQQEVKKQEINKIWDKYKSSVPGLELDSIFNDKWLNATCKLNLIETEMSIKINEIEGDLLMINSLIDDSYERALTRNSYLKSLNKTQAIQEFQERKRLKDLEEVKNKLSKMKTNQSKDIQEAVLHIKGTIYQLKALRDYLDNNNIEYKLNNKGENI